MSTERNDGGPAFPLASPAAEWDAERGGWRATNYAITGMTLRDYFAAKAMQGMLAAGRDVQYGGGTLQSEATAAYQIADAMLKAREA